MHCFVNFIRVHLVGQTDVYLQPVTSYPRRMPVVLSVWTGSQETRISKAVRAEALMLAGPTVGSVRGQGEVRGCNIPRGVH